MRPRMHLKQSLLAECSPAHPDERRRNPRRAAHGVMTLNILKSDLRSAPIHAFLLDLSASGFRASHTRSEEHTSELQSHSDLVCRLLLEKKKTITKQTHNKRRHI